MTIDLLNSHQTAALPPAPKARPGDGVQSRDTMAPGAQAAAGTEAADDGLSFWDVLDIVNPLQHIPVVSSIYRAVTGDEIGDAARIAGGALFGGPIGLAVAGVSYAVKAVSGKHIDEHVTAMFSGDQAPPPATARSPAVAEAAKAVDAAAAKAPGTPPAAVSPTAEAEAEAPAAPPRITGKWFSLDGTERRDPFMPLGAQAKTEAALRQRQNPPVERPADTPPDAQASTAGTVEVRPLGSPGTGRPATSNMPLGLLQGVPDMPTAQAGRPDPQAVRRAMRAQGLAASDHPAFAGLGAPPPVLPAATAQRPAGQGTARPSPEDAADQGAVAVPAWFDTAMQKALNAYEKTGRLSGG